MRHQDLTINHRLESWVYANAAARLGASGFVAGDVGRIAYQTDTGEYWRLTSTTPTWASIVVLPTATLQTTSTSPTATSSTAGVMMGLGAGGNAAVITPVRSGKIFVMVSGAISNSSTGGAQTGMRYGTGSAPANGAALVGTSVGSSATRGGVGAGFQVPFAISAVITGLTLNTQIWLDVILIAQTAGSAVLNPVAVSAFELP